MALLNNSSIIYLYFGSVIYLFLLQLYHLWKCTFFLNWRHYLLSQINFLTLFMIALNPIKKDELSHTEPKLWNRRRQIETPTVFNNVEEIPDSIERKKNSILFVHKPQKLAIWMWTVEGTVAVQTWHWLAILVYLMIAYISELKLTGAHLWHRHTICLLFKIYATSDQPLAPLCIQTQSKSSIPYSVLTNM